MKCADCSKTMTPNEVGEYAASGFARQWPDEGICPRCLDARLEEGDDWEDMIAEFCG